MIPKIFINLEYCGDKLEILGFTNEYVNHSSNFKRSLFLPDIISHDDLIITWLKEMKQSQKQIDIIIESLTELGMKAAHILNERLL